MTGSKSHRRRWIFLMRPFEGCCVEFCPSEIGTHEAVGGEDCLEGSIRLILVIPF
jgi:hypothetical protein